MSTLSRLGAGMVLAGVLALMSPARAGAQPAPTLDDAKMSYSMEKWQGALVTLDLLISKQKVKGAELAEAYAFRGRCLVHLEHPAEAAEAFRLAHRQDAKLVPDASWTPEEAATFVGAIETAPVAAAAAEQPPEPAAPASRAGQFYVRASFGRAGGEFQELNDYITGLYDSFDGLGSAWAYGFEAGYRLSDAVSVGVGFDRGEHSVSNTYYDVGELRTVSQDVGVSISQVSANLTWWMASAQGMFLGVEGGMGFGKLTEDAGDYDINLAGPTTDYSVTGEFTGNGFCGAVFGGYELALPGFSLFAKGGYRLRSLGELKGHFSGDTAMTVNSESVDGSYRGLEYFGQDSAIKTDASGMFVTIGMGIWFGGR